MNYLWYDRVMQDIRRRHYRFPEIIHGVKGMLQPNEAKWLHLIPRVVRDGTYVDLGTYKGRSALLLADTIREEKLEASVLTVDTFDGRCVGGKNNHERVMQVFEEKGLEDYIHTMRATTVEAAAWHSALKIDFLFIDADHSYKAVKADFEAWSPMVKKEGIVAFHDSHKPAIQKFHSEIKGWEQFDLVYTLSAWRRK
jgi:predicted O-methyltransferase YrrM